MTAFCVAATGAISYRTRIQRLTRSMCWTCSPD